LNGDDRESLSVQKRRVERVLDLQFAREIENGLDRGERGKNEKKFVATPHNGSASL
jgi:hypothetical protein